MQTISGPLRDPLTLAAVAGVMGQMSFTADGALIIALSGTTPSGVPSGLRVTTLADIPSADFVGLEVASVLYSYDGTNAVPVRAIGSAGIALASFKGPQSAAALFASDGASVVPVTLAQTAGVVLADFKGVPTLAVQAASDGTNYVPLAMNGGTPHKDADVSVLVTTTTLTNANVSRDTLFLQNNGIFDVWVSFGAGAAVVGSKLKLAAGASISFSGRSCPSQAVQAIANGGTSQVYVLETNAG